MLHYHWDIAARLVIVEDSLIVCKIMERTRFVGVRALQTWCRLLIGLHADEPESATH